MLLMEVVMDSSGPKRPAWWITLVIWTGVILGIVGILAHLVPIGALSGSSFWLLSIGWLLLSVAAAAIFLGRLVKW